MQNAKSWREYFVIIDDYVWVRDGERINTENGHWIDTGFFYPNEENPANIKVLDKSKFTKLSCNRIPFYNKITVEKLPYGLSTSDFQASYDTDKLLQLAQLLQYWPKRRLLYVFTVSHTLCYQKLCYMVCFMYICSNTIYMYL